jgi:ribonuclease PH
VLFRSAAISVGLVGGEVCVDLDYSEDSNADVDMNVVATAGGKLIEVQATSENQAIERAQFDALLDAALGAMNSLCSIQREALEAANMSLAPLLKSDNA